MKKFIIEDDFWEVFPKAKIGIVICNNIDNSKENHDANIKVYESLLENAGKIGAGFITDEEFSNNTVIKVWREAYQKFKTKKGARCSVEAMLKRINSGNQIGTINPLVDIYNSISLKYALPCGGEDIDTFVGDIRLTKAKGNEGFITLGSDESAPPYEGEIVYKDDEGAICRCWNWRESVRTMLTENTRNAFLCLESVDEGIVDEFKAALEELIQTVQTHLGGTYRKAILDIDNKTMDIANS